MSGPVRLLLVDDHSSSREPLAILLDRQPDLEVVGQAGSLAEARHLLIRRQGRHRGRRPRSGRWQRCGPDPRSLKTESRSPGAGADWYSRRTRAWASDRGRGLRYCVQDHIDRRDRRRDPQAERGVPLMAPAEARALMERGMAHQRKTEEERGFFPASRPGSGRSLPPLPMASTTRRSPGG